MAARPCTECGRRPKYGQRLRCKLCWLRHQPIDVQVEAARRRLGMIPDELRLARVPARLWPAGMRWCASCQSFLDLADMRGARCHACSSSAAHDARVEKVYGLTPAQYDELAALQDGKCAICRARPVSKRLAVDHDHETSEVRGLLCSRCNHDLMGASWDSLVIAYALVNYLENPPTSGRWKYGKQPDQPALPPSRPELVGPGTLGRPAGPKPLAGPTGPDSPIFVGSATDENGFYRIYAERGPGPAPF